MGNYVLTSQAVRKLRGALAATPGNSGAAGAPSPVNIDDFPPPFTVRWSASANSGAGAWVIWLPDASSLVHIGNAYVSPISNIVAEAALPTGWYRATTVTPTSTAVWLNITTYAATGQVFLDISNSAGQSATGFVCVPIQIATMAVDAQTGAKRVKQFVDSTITFGGGGGGSSVVPDDVSTEFIPQPAQGEQPDGDEGKLQIKGFKTGTPVDANSIADQLQGINTLQDGSALLCREVGRNGQYRFIYIPIKPFFRTDAYRYLSFVGDIQWNSTTHTLQKRVDTVDLRNGFVTQGGWSDIGNATTTPISSIIN